MDLPNAAINENEIKDKVSLRAPSSVNLNNYPVMLMSAINNKGVRDVVHALRKLLSENGRDELA